MKTDTASNSNPGLVVLFGSGETSPSGQKVFETVLRQMPPAPRVALLETPAGFELNSTQVIQRVADFLTHRLQNYRPQPYFVAARQRGTMFSPDDPALAGSLLEADLIFMGPGSPTYAVRQLRDSLVWYNVLARHRLGAVLVLASAAVMAASAYSLPVYEIYKVGEDLHWKTGLNLFGPYGLELVFVPHWNNADGGSELDTSRCFMGQARFTELLALLPPGQTVIGIDEKTALLLYLHKGIGRVVGRGSVTVLQTPFAKSELADSLVMPTGVKTYRPGEQFSLDEYGPVKIPDPGTGIPPHVWQRALQAVGPNRRSPSPPEAVTALMNTRQEARRRKDWVEADRLRAEILHLGWNVIDTPAGSVLEPVDGM